MAAAILPGSPNISSNLPSNLGSNNERDYLARVCFKRYIIVVGGIYFRTQDYSPLDFVVMQLCPQNI